MCNIANFQKRARPTAQGVAGASKRRRLMKHPIDELMAEHRVIESVLDAIERELSGDPSGGDSSTLRADFWLQVADFVANYADRRHHGKEEGVLFPLLNEAGLPEGDGPIAVMLQEHIEGRELGRPNAGGGAESRQPEPTYAAARAYVHLLRDHIMKEDQVLFEMARRMLSDEQVGPPCARASDRVNAEFSTEDEEYMALARG